MPGGQRVPFEQCVDLTELCAAVAWAGGQRQSLELPGAAGFALGDDPGDAGGCGQGFVGLGCSVVFCSVYCR